MPFGRFDVAALIVGAVALVLWVARPEAAVTGVAMGLAALLHGVRMLRWIGVLTLGSPLLTMLHIAYGFVPLGLAAGALAAFGRADAATAPHLLGIGAIGGMTLAVMIRATMGHTGRQLVSGPRLNIAFVAVAAAGLARIAGYSEVLPGVDGIQLSAMLWTLGFALAVVRLLPWLASARVAPRKPSRAALRV